MKLNPPIAPKAAAIALLAHLLTLLPSHATAQNITTTTPTACAGGVHIITARGSSEDLSSGRLDPVASDLAAAIPNSTIQALDYPATILDYPTSVAAGIAELRDALVSYSGTCPPGQVVLMGFSQGAQVILDTLCGAEPYERPLVRFNESTPLNATIVERNVLAVVLYGDPTHAADAPWNHGNSTTDGLFPRGNITACESYAPKIRAWCDEGDYFCARGDNDETHGSYFDAYGDETVEFVLQRYEEAEETEAVEEAGGDDEDEAASESGNGPDNDGGNSDDSRGGNEDASRDDESVAVHLGTNWRILFAIGAAVCCHLVS